MKAFSLGATDDPKLSRILDENGDWTHYFDEESKRTLRATNFILSRGFNKGYAYYEALKNSTPEEWERKMQKGADKGDAVHQAATILFSTGKIDITTQILADDNKTLRNLTRGEWKAVLALGRLFNDHGMKLATPTSFEKSVKNLEIGYAGTADWFAIMTKECGNRYCKCKNFIGKLGLGDHKSGKGVYADYGPQTASYAHADLTKILGDKKPEFTFIDHIGVDTERGYRIAFYDAEETERHWKEFLAADVIMRNDYKPFDFLNDNEEIEEKAEITL